MHAARVPNAFSTAVFGMLVVSLALVGTANAGDVKGTITEYRLVQGDDLYKHIGDIRVPVIELEFRGTSKMFDAQVELRWTISDAEPYLKLISACAGGRLNVLLEADFEPGDKKIEGKGPIKELRFRKILR